MHVKWMERAVMALVAIIASMAPARAQEIEIGPDEGAVFDAILDGFPGQAPFDGTPDFGGNALGIGLRIMATEERAIVEFPLELLGGASGAAIESATVIFNIDDVLSTFGPGTAFTGFAAEEILLHVYAGDGVVDLPDFNEIARAAHLVSTTGLGRINDASLRASGPLTFEVDITADLRELTSAAADFAGVVWRTTDSPTGTSIDNRGDGGAGPDGVNGSFLPYLRVVLGDVTTPTPTATATPDGPTATRPPPATSTPTTAGCPGDCNDDGQVLVSELVRSVNIALEQADVALCEAADVNNSGTVTVEELVRSVTAALNGC